MRPGATYIYESTDNGQTIFAREKGTTNKILIGMSAHVDNLNEELNEDKLWSEIRRAALDNEDLRRALEHCIILYYIDKHGS